MTNEKKNMQPYICTKQLTADKYAIQQKQKNTNTELLVSYLGQAPTCRMWQKYLQNVTGLNMPPNYTIRHLYKEY